MTVAPEDLSRRAKQALEMFQRLENVSSEVFNAHDEDRLRLASTPSKSKKVDNRTTPPRSLSVRSGVDDTLLKKLHARNKELQAQLDALSLQVQGAVTQGPTKPPLAPSKPASRPATTDTETIVLKAQVQSLQKQLEELRQVNLSCIQQGEATGKVNREVKMFFQATRSKFMEDAARHEAERALWNASILDMERQLCARECGSL